MQCPQCQAETPDRARFCEDCGARLEFKCPHCGEDATPGKKFCASCGESLAAAPAVSRLASSPQDYTPQHLAERIISSRGAIEGERKQVTVLFADLKGSMELLADRDPEEARRILDPVLEHMMEAVHRYEGTVNQVMGDGIMALFGAPLAHEDHAVRACYAALRMQESVKEYANEIFLAQGVRPQIRVGLNSGEVVVRSIGSDLRMDYTAVGQTTHLAARMEQLALPGTIRLAPATLRLVEGLVHVRSLGPLPVKGLSTPVVVYDLLGAASTRTRLQAAAAQGLTKFVGRDAELDTLRRALEQAGGGHGQLVALVGEPGVGKSRLTREFIHSHRTQGWLVLDTRSVSYGKATSYLPVTDLLKSYCGIEDRDDARRMREKVTGKLLTLDPALQPLLPPLLALLDLPVDDPQWQGLDPPQRRQRTLDACKRLLLRESTEQPLLLVFEDLHWIDAETQALLNNLVDSLPTARVLLLVNYRPEYEHSWHRKTYYQQLRLDPLPPASAEELLIALLGPSAELQALKRLLIERTEGNPFFVEESVRTLIEGGVLTGERGGHRLGRPFESAQVPATVQAVLSARIDRLAPEDKRLLQAAAVIGKDVPYPLLQHIMDTPEGALREGLARLQASEFLYETSLFPDLEYTFKHALTHEVTYGSLLQERRRALHARIVDAAEALYPDRLVEQAERLAHHATRGEVWVKAVGYSRQAATKASGPSAHREAVLYLEQALEALRHWPEDRETHEQAVDVRLGLRNSLFPIGELTRAIEHLREAEALAETLDDSRRLGLVSAYMGQVFWQLGDHLRAVESSERALALAISSNDLAIQVEANFRTGVSYFWLGDYQRALDHFRASVASLDDELSRERFGLPFLPYVNSRGWMAWCYGERGEFTAGHICAGEAHRVAAGVDQPWSAVMADWGLGQLHLDQGNFYKALPLLESALATSVGYDYALLSAPLRSAVGYTYALSGRTAEALPLLEQALQQTATMGHQGFRSWLLTRLSEAYLWAGRLNEARATAMRTLEVTQSQRERGREAWTLRLLGEIAAQADPPEFERADSYYCEALALADELGMRPLVAHCRLGLGRLHQKIGRDAEAQAELATATEMYRAMEMPFWLEQAEAALATGGAA